MKRIYLASCIILAISFQSCMNANQEQIEEAEQSTEEVSEESTAEKTTEKDGDGVHFGKMISAEDAKSTSYLASIMETEDSVRIKIAATAVEVCQKKGCWMKVEIADGSLMRIRFKDYAFFVPKDISGKEVIFEGIAYKDTTTVEDLRHYAEDAGKSEEEIAAITEAEFNTAFLADGVLIRQEN